MGSRPGHLLTRRLTRHVAREDRRREFGFRNGPLFCTLSGGTLSDHYVRNMLKRVAAQAGFEKLGHSSLAVTDRYLWNVAPADLITLRRSRTWMAGE